MQPQKLPPIPICPPPGINPAHAPSEETLDYQLSSSIIKWRPLNNMVETLFLSGVTGARLRGVAAPKRKLQQDYFTTIVVMIHIRGIFVKLF